MESDQKRIKGSSPFQRLCTLYIPLPQFMMTGTAKINLSLHGLVHPCVPAPNRRRMHSGPEAQFLPCLFEQSCYSRFLFLPISFPATSAFLFLSLFHSTRNESLIHRLKPLDFLTASRTLKRRWYPGLRLARRLRRAPAIHTRRSLFCTFARTRPHQPRVAPFLPALE